MAEIPGDIAKALKENGLAEFFAGCTDSHRREYLKWIGEAKRPETREARIKKAMALISAKRAEENARLKKRG
ncbi:MAG: YdeI/OmpD-associated family protein [Opitutaceae bacterium]